MACGLCYLDVESFTERCVMSVGSCSEGSCEDRQGTSSSWSLFTSHQIWQSSLLFWSSGPSSRGDVFLYIKFLFLPSIVTTSIQGLMMSKATSFFSPLLNLSGCIVNLLQSLHNVDTGWVW